MYERKPSGLLRTGALLLAVLMAFGNLYLPNGAFAAKAAETGNNALPVVEDFEDHTVGTSGPFSVDSPEGANAKGEIFETGIGNKMLAVSNKGGTVDGDAVLFLKKGSAYYKDPVYLSYWLAADAVEGRFLHSYIFFLILAQIICPFLLRSQKTAIWSMRQVLPDRGML